MDPGADDRGAAREPLAEPAALPWGMDKADVQKSSFTELTDEKLARFVIGQQKKTKFEKEREEREIKKRKADEEAAAMYAKFVASFEDEDDAMGKAFVRGGGASDEAIYRLQSSGSKKKVSDMDRLMGERKQKESESFLQPPMKKKRREMDLLVEEIKSREPTLPTAEEIGPVKGSFDHGDPTTTNLHVGNLALTVTEETLERVFGTFGRIFSVKVMWPRSEEERSRGRMSGFVSFYERRAADDARVHLNDSELDGQRIVIGWGKAVKIEATPLPSPLAATLLSRPTGAGVMGQSKIVVLIPKEETQRKLIDYLASYVAKDGEAFEAAVRFREAGNPQYAFLKEVNSEAAVYYRWRVFAFAMGDSATKWREAPFRMTVDGPVWVPPSVPAASPREDQRRAQRSSRDRQTRSPSRSRHRGRSPRRGHSRSSSRSRSRGSSRGRSRRRSRSGSRDRRRRRSRSVSRSRSSSSDRSGCDRRRRASRSRSRARGSERRPEGDRSSSRRDSRDHRARNRSTSRSRSPYTRRDDFVLKKDESLLTGQQLARARDLERGREPNRLARDEHDRFADLLDNLTLERESIKQAMGCALDNSESAVELVHMLRKRFHRDDVSAVQLVGYLYVASDLLHNSSAAVKNASLFRTTFQECLPEIVDSLRRVHRGLQGRMSANAMRDKVLSVLTAWGSWSLFPPHYLVGLNATFMRKVEEDEYIAAHQHEFTAEGLEGTVEEERLRKACVQAGILSSGSAREMLARLQWLKEFTAPSTAVKKPAVVPAVAKPLKELGDDEGVAEPMAEDTVRDSAEEERRHGSNSPGIVKPSLKEEESRDDGGEPLDGEPLDGEEDLDGEPLDEPEPEADEDLDGEPLDEEDLDGEPLDEEEDLDGEPM